MPRRLSWGGGEGRLAVSDVNGRLEYGPTKTFERRWVRLPQFLVERLARQLESVAADPDALVFRGQRGVPLRYQIFRRAAWDKAVTEAPATLRGSSGA